MRFFLILVLLLLCCAKKEEPLQAYSPPPIEWTEDLDLDDLPEAGDTAEDEDY